MDYIGFGTEVDPPLDHLDWHIEAVTPEQLDPPNLCEAMRAHRQDR